MPEDLIKAINEMDIFTTNMKIEYFDSDHYTAQGDHFDNTKMMVKISDDVDNSEHESYNELDRSQQIDSKKLDTRFH